MGDAGFEHEIVYEACAADGAVYPPYLFFGRIGAESDRRMGFHTYASPFSLWLSEDVLNQRSQRLARLVQLPEATFKFLGQFHDLFDLVEKYLGGLVNSLESGDRHTIRYMGFGQSPWGFQPRFPCLQRIAVRDRK